MFAFSSSFNCITFHELLLRSLFGGEGWLQTQMGGTDWEESGQLIQVHSPGLTGAAQYAVKIVFISISAFSLPFFTSDSLYGSMLFKMKNCSIVPAIVAACQPDWYFVIALKDVYTEVMPPQLQQRAVASCCYRAQIWWCALNVSSQSWGGRCMRDEHRSGCSEGDCRSAACQQRGGTKQKNWNITILTNILEELILGACRNSRITLCCPNWLFAASATANVNVFLQQMLMRAKKTCINTGLKGYILKFTTAECTWGMIALCFSF